MYYILMTWKYMVIHFNMNISTQLVLKTWKIEHL